MRCLGVILLTLMVGATPAYSQTQSSKQDQDEKIVHYRRDQFLALAAGTTATLTNGAGDGSVAVTMDAYGSLPGLSAAGSALYDPIGPLASVSTTFESGIFIGEPILGNFATTDSFGASLPALAFDTVSQTIAASTFNLGSMRVQLVQSLSPIGPAGSTLAQVYAFTNTVDSLWSSSL